MSLCRLSRCVSVVSINLVPNWYVRVWYTELGSQLHFAGAKRANLRFGPVWGACFGVAGRLPMPILYQS